MNICWSRSGIDLPVSGVQGEVYAGVGQVHIDLPVSGAQGEVYAGVGQV